MKVSSIRGILNRFWLMDGIGYWEAWLKPKHAEEGKLRGREESRQNE
jgi:hypothetical protein